MSSGMHLCFCGTKTPCAVSISEGANPTETNLSNFDVVLRRRFTQAGEVWVLCTAIREEIAKEAAFKRGTQKTHKL